MADRTIVEHNPSAAPGAAVGVAVATLGPWRLTLVAVFWPGYLSRVGYVRRDWRSLDERAMRDEIERARQRIADRGGEWPRCRGHVELTWAGPDARRPDDPDLAPVVARLIEVAVLRAIRNLPLPAPEPS